CPSYRNRLRSTRPRFSPAVTGRSSSSRNTSAGSRRSASRSSLGGGNSMPGTEASCSNWRRPNAPTRPATTHGGAKPTTTPADCQRVTREPATTLLIAKAQPDGPSPRARLFEIHQDRVERGSAESLSGRGAGRFGEDTKGFRRAPHGSIVPQHGRPT